MSLGPQLDQRELMPSVGRIPSCLPRALCLPALALALAVFASGPGIAEYAFSFDATPGRLPKSVVPIHYAITLEPNLDTLTVAGSQVVQIEVREPTARLVLNALNMDIEHAVIDGVAERAQIALDAAAETATLTFPQPIAAGRHTLRMAFKSHINRFSRGIYYVDYPTERGTKRMIATQLEPADARRIFPSWDEPAFKASFELAVTVPQAFTAVGNMPVTREEAAGPGAKRVSFAPTPKMSSYLFVLAAGEFERLTEEADGVTVSVVTTLGKREQGRFALESAIRLLHYFNDYFGVKYPLPKLDLIGIPGGFTGAMENWGGITFFESLLLFDPATSAPAARRAHLQHHRPRDCAPVVRRSRHHGVVGRHLAERRLCELDADEGGRALLPAMAELAQRQRSQAGRDERGRAAHLASDPAQDRQ